MGARRTLRVDRRLGRGLLFAAVVLVVATGWRAARLVEAHSGDGAALQRVDVDSLGGGLRMVPAHGGAFAVEVLGDGSRHLLEPRGELRVGGARLRLQGAPDRHAEVLRRDWAVFAPKRGCGHRRIDFGGDPLGRADGARDRVVLPGDGPWFRLEPAGDCFDRERGEATLVVERPGLTLTVGDVPRALALGERVDVRRRFRIAGDDVALRVGWEDAARAEPVVVDGVIRGYRGRSGLDFVVAVAERDPDAGPTVRIDDGPDERSIPLATSGPTLLFGRRDRVGPLTGRVLPGRAPDEVLEAAVADGLAGGWIAPRPERTAVDVSEADLDPSTARSLVTLLDRWDRARAPAALRLGDGLSAAGARSGRAPLRWDPALEAWTPSDRPHAGADVAFRIPIEPGAKTVEVAAAFPISWSVDDDPPTRLPAPASPEWTTHRLDVHGRRLHVVVHARPPVPGGNRLAVRVAGGPAGTLLGVWGVHWGRKAFDGWDRPGAAGVAMQTWTPVPGDRWRAGVILEPVPAHRSRHRAGFVLIPLAADAPGWAAVDLTLPGPAREAWWDGERLPLDALPTDPSSGTTRVSLPVRPGGGSLAIRFDQPRAHPAQEAGGVRFALAADGALEGLAERVADRRARGAVVHPEAAPVADGTPELVVEAGIPGLDAGTVWRPSPGADAAATSELRVLGGDGPVLRNRYGSVEVTAGALRWRNGPALALGVVRRVESDPSGPPLAGFRVAPSALQPLVDDGDAILGPTFRSEVIAGDTLRGSTIVVSDGARTQLLHSGDPRWEAAGGGAAVRVRVDGRRVAVSASPEATLWTATGTPRAVGEDWSPWPDGARLVAGRLRLLRRSAAGPAPGSTIDPDIQHAADEALSRVVGDAGLDDGDPLALRAAVVALDPISGDILACASRDRPAADPRTRPANPCWDDVGLHPGSTFKVGVATAALDADDLDVQRMLDGLLPSPLTRDGPRADLRGARLPTTPGERPLRLASRLKNHRRALMPTDATLEDALRSSLNTWFGYVGLLMHRPLRGGWGSAGIVDAEHRAGAWPVARVASAAGFGRRVDLGGAYGTGGSFPTTAVEGDAPLAARAIGQGDVTATPLGVAALLAPALAGGLTPTPRLRSDRAIQRERVMDAGAAERLRDALRGVVLTGTAARAFSDHPRRDRMLGKTGSAQRIDQDGVSRTDAWFVGALLGEGDERPVVFAAVVPGGGLGGRSAAEIVDLLSRDVLRIRAAGDDPES